MALVLPRRDAELLPFAKNFSKVLSAQPEVFGCSVQQAETLGDLVVEFAAVLAAASHPSTRTRGTVASKNELKAALKANLRLVARLAHAQPNVAGGQLIDLGLRPRAASARIGAPAEAPVVRVVSVFGRTLKVRLQEAGGDGRARPTGVGSASVYSFVGAVAPEDAADWAHCGNFTRTSFEIDFPAATPAGSQIWIHAVWRNPRGIAGPRSMPIDAYLGGGVSIAA